MFEKWIFEGRVQISGMTYFKYKPRKSRNFENRGREDMKKSSIYNDNQINCTQNRLYVCHLYLRLLSFK